MKPKNILPLIVLLLLLIQQNAFALVGEVQLDQTNILHSQFEVKVTPLENEVSYQILYHKDLRAGQTNIELFAYLNIYDGDRFIAGCPVAIKHNVKDTGEVLIYEFKVAKSYIKQSCFLFTNRALDKDGIGRPSAVKYQINLADFSEGK